MERSRTVCRDPRAVLCSVQFGQSLPSVFQVKLGGALGIVVGKVSPGWRLPVIPKGPSTRLTEVCVK